jgi:hypothetical protein
MMESYRDIILVIASKLPWRYKAKLCRVSKKIWGAMRDLMREIKYRHYSEYIAKNFRLLKFGNLPQKYKKVFSRRNISTLTDIHIDILTHIAVVYEVLPPQRCGMHIPDVYMNMRADIINQYTDTIDDLKIVQGRIFTPIHFHNIKNKTIKIYSNIKPLCIYISGYMGESPPSRYQISWTNQWSIREYGEKFRIICRLQNYRESKIEFAKLMTNGSTVTFRHLPDDLFISPPES